MVTDPLYTYVQQRFILLNTMLDDLLEACSTSDSTERDERVQRIIDYANHRGLHKTPDELRLLFLSGAVPHDS